MDSKTRIEYRVEAECGLVEPILIHDLMTHTNQQVSAWLNTLGADGWNLVCYGDFRYIFSRIVPDKDK